MPSMKIARLWSSVIDGVPTLDVSLSRADVDAPIDLMLHFLDGGSEVIRASGLGEDWLFPNHPLVVPIGYRTDGVWIWSEELAYYLKEHQINPDEELLRHMVLSDYNAAQASEQDLAEAEQLLRG